MIIEAGYDLGQLIHPELFASDESKRGLWMLAMDKHLRLSFLDKVSDEMSGSVEPHIPDIVAALENHYTPLRYFVLAHMMPRLGSGIAEWVYRDDTPLRESPSLAQYQFLGRLVFDGEYAYSSAPRYSFRDYVGYEDLPRAAVIPGPHGFDCVCVACAQHEAILAENRRRYEALHADSPADAPVPGPQTALDG